MVITSGLLRSLQENGLRSIVEMEITGRKASVKEFLIGWFHIYPAESPIILSQIEFATNNSWEEISGLGGFTGYPLLHSARYANGVLYVLNVPDNFSDLYHLPVEVLTRIKETLCKDLPVSLEAPAQVALFVYDNQTCIVESFLDEAADIRIVTGSSAVQVRDALTGEILSGEEILDWRGQPTGRQAFATRINPHQYRLFEWVLG